ncbi:hypothetical protein JCM33774_89200 [Actinophytocola sp. KF-1]
MLTIGLALPVATPASGVAARAGDTVSLSAAVTILDQAADTRPGTVTGWYVDTASRSVVVSVHGAADGVIEWARGHGVSAVTVEHVAELPRPLWDLVGGQPIRSDTGVQCTLGFNARSATARYVLAAGHCLGGGGAGWYGVGGYIGPGAGSSFPTNDYGAIQVTSVAAVSTPLVDRASGDVTISGVATPGVGASVCSSSPVSGWRCGSVTAINATVCYAQGCVYQLIRTTLCAEPGGSGAPVVTNPGAGTRAQAVGLVSGGSGNCTSGGTTYVQPVAEPLAVYGLTLVTG